jgi:hypothetical protein
MRLIATMLPSITAGCDTIADSPPSHKIVGDAGPNSLDCPFRAGFPPVPAFQSSATATLAAAARTARNKRIRMPISSSREPSLPDRPAPANPFGTIDAMSRPPRKRDPQAGKAIERVGGDEIIVLFPDAAARPVKSRVRQGRTRRNASHGSHMNGRHKMG